jgi:hypothetical protein
VIPASEVDATLGALLPLGLVSREEASLISYRIGRGEHTDPVLIQPEIIRDRTELSRQQRRARVLKGLSEPNGLLPFFLCLPLPLYLYPFTFTPLPLPLYLYPFTLQTRTSKVGLEQWRSLPLRLSVIFNLVGH